MMRRISLLTVLTTSLLAAPAAADTKKLTADGTLHTIEVVTTSGRTPTVFLRHTRRPATGGPVAVTVPGTEDAVIDREPAIEIDPVSGQLVLVWSRFDGTDYNVFVSRYNGTSWSAPKPVVRAAGDDVEPQVLISDHYVHVGWRQVLAGQSNFYRESLLSTSLDPAYGPERLVTSDLWPVPAEGAMTAGVSDPPTTTERIFSGVLYPSNTTDPGRFHLWGVRDEPVPIGYREIVNLPPQARGASSTGCGVLGGRFTIWYVAGSRFYYATRCSGVWSPTRSVDLTAGVSASDARLIVADANARGSN
ncbi:MAG TPA: hypothetical protein VJ826_16800 [Candidatus Polarisedimenticolaceae bacterium]|nr:hypothetical protein [Candidatus Polarisedimenticolaceae bacterium]